MKYLNLGCGYHYSAGNYWTNMDFISNSKEVIAHNLLNGIPFSDNSFDLVYHSHVLEHFPKEFASKFIAECHRVLKPGGIIRVVIPDLEQIALNYIKYLNEAVNGVSNAPKKYEWTLMEMYDQFAREKSGGYMVDYLKDISKNNDDFVIERNGKEVKDIIELLRKPNTRDSRSKIRTLLSSIYHINIRELMTKFVLQKNYSVYKQGLFRKQGEIHQWMYDRYSIHMILEKNGFRNIEKKTAFSSYINEWSSYNLDGENEMIRKPDSLFMEGIKKG